jgi:serine/threonine protein kinase
MHGNMTIQQFVGQTFGGYKLLKLVGVGGMGAVYRAKQLSLDREVAVKVMSPELLMVK